MSYKSISNKQLRSRSKELLGKRAESGQGNGSLRLCKLGRRMVKARVFGRMAL